ncbi:PadR family transcriptional regulator [Streptomyces stelliscabiei]|uniref:DNA-binding PadR family transcriptional regulator n=1 Tax=Streptomyces stelliscabiei TaxID=146820 RepID=A0A8I0TYZ8_9ACTN|nr:PadR family transcriptional regulator [Streptomyces stelliscabiei]MBE1602918.1 DNA-binding PadR family transcriptional regulator [Streptomyces stelliscabiei]MDX2521747.1 PadR family transcriptional regulator [Streptomyces stelliscabiei]
MDVKLTPQTERVLQVFRQDPAAPRYGYELMKAAKLASGTLYPILSRLSDAGLVESEWETSEEGQRPRRYYKLTAEGVRVAHLELARLSFDRVSGGVGRARPAPGGAS